MKDVKFISWCDLTEARKQKKYSKILALFNTKKPLYAIKN